MSDVNDRGMRTKSLLIAAIVAAGVLVNAGCGSGSGTHLYSVSRVRTAFAAEGIRLRRDLRDLADGWVFLRGTNVIVSVRTVQQTHNEAAFPVSGIRRGDHLITKPAIDVIYRSHKE